MPPSLKTSSVGRIFGLVLILVIVVVIAPAVSYLGVVFGWTNPTQDPPGGSGILTAYNGNLGVNAATPSTTLTVNGIISAVGNRIVDVDTPVAGTDAVNKDYVNAQVAASGAGAGSIVLYGVSGVTNVGGYQRPGGGLSSNCYRNISGPGINCAQMPAVTTPAGTGAPACPTGWTEAYAGFGPFGTLFTWYNLGSDPEETDAPTQAVAPTYSVCANSAFLVIPDHSANNGTNTVGNSVTALGACSLTQNGGNNNEWCNTCRVCVK
ncbi:MAG: hypothetical protein Q7R62_03075 [bacterium]|nr:hypothetical protein [bacterium]